MPKNGARLSVLGSRATSAGCLGQLPRGWPTRRCAPDALHAAPQRRSSHFFRDGAAPDHFGWRRAVSAGLSEDRHGTEYTFEKSTRKIGDTQAFADVWWR